MFLSFEAKKKGTSFSAEVVGCLETTIFEAM